MWGEVGEQGECGILTTYGTEQSVISAVRKEAAMFLLPLVHDIFIEQLLYANKLCYLLGMEMRRCNSCSQGAHGPVGRQGLKKS